MKNLDHLISYDTKSTRLKQRFHQEISEVDLENYPISSEMYDLLRGIFNREFGVEEADFSFVETEDVLNYLYATHDFYLGKKLPEIEQSIFDLNGKADEPLLEVLDAYFRKFRTELTEHIMYEERHVFPLVLGSQCAQQVDISEFHAHHDDHNERGLEMIISVIEDRLASHVDSLGLGILVNRLRLFLEDLEIHSKLEDHVLIPRITSG